MIEDSLQCSLNDLMRIFQSSLHAMKPIAERLMLEWRDDDQHRDWERLAEALYDVCVRGPIESDASRRVDEYPIPRYDIDVDSYSQFSWIGVRHPEMIGGSPLALIRWRSSVEAFDSIQVAILDPDTFAPLRQTVVLEVADADFEYVRRSPRAADQKVRRVEAID